MQGKIVKASSDAEHAYWETSAHEATEAEVAEAIGHLHRVIDRLAGLDARVSLLLTKNDSLLIDAVGNPAILTRSKATADVSVTIAPQRLIAIIRRELEPRTAIQYGYMRVTGDARLAIRFGDLLSATSPFRPALPNRELPLPTSDIAQAKLDLNEFGYCLIRDALSQSAVASLRKRLIEQSEAETALGIAFFDGGPSGPNQRVRALINKGEEFEQLLASSIIPNMCVPCLGDHFILGSYTANIAGPGGLPQAMHYDQQVFQPSPTFQVGLNIAWFLDDVTDENGGTRLFPGSHLWERGPEDPFSIEGTVAAAGPKGTALMWDSRLWHGTGPNRTREKRHVLLAIFYRYYFRANQNFSLLLRPEVEARLNNDVKTMLGFRITGRLGTLEESAEGKIVTRNAVATGRLELVENRPVARDEY